jgi:hypothetical protein
LRYAPPLAIDIPSLRDFSSFPNSTAILEFREQQNNYGKGFRENGAIMKIKTIPHTKPGFMGLMGFCGIRFGVRGRDFTNWNSNCYRFVSVAH